MLISSLFSTFRRGSQRRNSQRKRVTRSISIEPLEVRQLLSAFTVVNLNDSGAGSLRQAIHDANAAPTADVINFDVAGTIMLTTGALPAITGKVDVRGGTAPGFAGAPVIEVDCNGFGGLVFTSTSAGSALRSLAIDGAAGAGVTLSGGGSTLIVGDYIGLGLDGATLAGNSGDGLVLHASFGNHIVSNVISGNGGNGIDLDGASSNRLEMNSIGTDATGTLALGNAQNGILVTNVSIGNTLGGVATGGNNPTGGVFVRPPQGNLISGNDANGVLINGHSILNVLEGNFIGTDATGVSALGNALDGVAIVNANGNSLIGCTAVQNPFVYYNVISGNGGNGLRINNSNDTTVQGNFFGLGADNQTPVGNQLNGVVVEGSSARTLMGGRIPLGNVDAANGLNGIVIKDTASGFISFNTFCGLAAFQTYTNLGNHADGMLITSTGGNNVIRTNVITENGNDGIEISGSARGVHIGENIIGLNTSGQTRMGNKNNGVEVDGNAHDIDIGGPKLTFSIIVHNVISANEANGVAITGNAHDVHVNYSDIGTNLPGLAALGNAAAGVFVGPGTHSVTIGSLDPGLRTLISGNGGDGVEMVGTSGNKVIGTLIGTDATGTQSLPNGGNGVFIDNSSNNIIGGAASIGFNLLGGPANVIAFNGANGVFVASGNDNGIRGNSIYGNTLLGIDLGPGANMNQAAPVLTSVHTQLGLILVAGTLTSTPNTFFTIEFFANDNSGPSGRVFLGSQLVRTNGAGVATFTFLGLRPALASPFITATATDPNNNTSEFSAPVS